MKKIFKSAFVAFAAFAMAVSCKPTVNPDHDKEPEKPKEPKIAIDGSFSDWKSIEGVSNEDGFYTCFKITSDEDNIYFYSLRSEDRVNELWGGNGYYYYCFDLDNDPTTGVELWGNGPYEVLMAVFPFAGTAESPAFEFSGDNAIAPDTYSLENIKLAGRVTADGGVETEISIPRSNLPEIGAEQEIKVETWGNKGANHLTYTGTI